MGLEGSTARTMDRELSFSNGIAASVCEPSTADDDRSNASDEEETSNAGFSFIQDEQHQLETEDDAWRRKEFIRNPDPKEEVRLTIPDDYEDMSPNTPKIKSEFSADAKQEEKLIRTVLITLLYVFIWYLFSTCLTLYNKILVGKKYWHFPAPLLMNTIHFTMQAIVSKLLLRFCFPSLAPAPMSWKDYFVRVVPAAVATALDVDLTNAALVFITVSFATMCKSATPVFLLSFAFLFKLEKPSFKLFGIIFLISSGVLLTVVAKDDQTKFILVGFILVMLAALSSGFRWVATQLLLQKKKYGLGNPLAVMSCFTPVMALVTAIFSFILEPWGELVHNAFFNTRTHIVESCGLMLAGGTLAFCMVMAEYLLISKTSAVTMTVAGVVKEVLTIVVAILYFGDKLTLFKALGFLIIIVGVALFNIYKYQSLVAEKSSVQQAEELQPINAQETYFIIDEDEESGIV